MVVVVNGDSDDFGFGDDCGDVVVVVCGEGGGGAEGAAVEVD